MVDKQILIFELTSYCNSNCEDCLRANINSEKYMMPFEEVCIALNEIKEFSQNYPEFEVKLSGGEPTIWKFEQYDITDVISECNIKKMNFALVTNGKVFANYNYCKDFFEKIQKKGVDSLKIYITIDNYHKNYTGMDNIILDNLLKIREEFKLDISVQSTVNKKKEENLDKEFIDKYFEKGIKFLMNPLLPWGRGKNLEEVVPHLNLKSNEKSKLGDYKKYYYILGKSKKVWDTYEEFLNINNLESIKALNCCGKTITLMEGKYYYCMPLSDKKELAFAKVGELDYNKYMSFVKNNKHIMNMKNNVFDGNTKNTTCNTPIGYGVCALCKKIYEGENDGNL